MTPDTGAHLARTIMLAELTTLLTQLPATASHDDYRKAVLVENVLAKPTASARRHCAKPLLRLYGFDPDLTLFRVLRALWDRDAAGRPLLAMLCALARDPLLRESAEPVLSLRPGESIAAATIEAAFSAAHPDRFGAETLQALASRLLSSWGQSGHLAGRSTRHRVLVVPTFGAVAYAVLLGFIEGRRGQLLFESLWARTLDAPTYVLLELAQVAARQGLLAFKKGGGVVEADPWPLLTDRERKVLGEPH
ncbi:MAG: hypothetical protein KA072_13675 [Thermoanaerobaculaceae bacterium]|nr:hypothetical protein [Thermoanaerobaculaceae bacterium]